MTGTGPTHVPVLADAVVEHLVGPQRRIIVDCTVGLGGHSGLLLEHIPNVRMIGLDRDPANLALAADRLSAFSERVRLYHSDFGQLATVLSELGEDRVDGVLADLGLSSNQIADRGRGFSFEVDGPLDMRMDPRQKTTAADLVNSLSQGELADLLYVQSQESRSRIISKRICEARRRGRLESSVELARLVASAVGQEPSARRGRIHPATRTFMALRMAVNAELASLQSLLADVPKCLRPGGRVAVISFHSMEDRIVKKDLRARSNEGVYRIVTKKPIVADRHERNLNPRSRSAKLRVAEMHVSHL